ncbi:hypothetical protein PVAG01_11023 [Phlyctema vagabunda]|uniref:Uncharacterized protein n=1 Tax=Phlyctema vagabunda TaxID=108571 RepID=A0ABR4P3Z5_9HELO
MKASTLAVYFLVGFASATRFPKMSEDNESNDSGVQAVLKQSESISRYTVNDIAAALEAILSGNSPSVACRKKGESCGAGQPCCPEAPWCRSAEGGGKKCFINEKD